MMIYSSSNFYTIHEVSFIILSQIIHEILCQIYDDLPKLVSMILEINFEQF